MITLVTFSPALLTIQWKLIIHLRVIISNIFFSKFNPKVFLFVFLFAMMETIRMSEDTEVPNWVLKSLENCMPLQVGPANTLIIERRKKHLFTNRWLVITTFNFVCTMRHFRVILIDNTIANTNFFPSFWDWFYHKLP